MRCGDIVFVAGKGFISDAIRFFDKGNFSHCGLAVSANGMLEAEYSHRVNVVPFNPSNYIRHEVIDLGLTELQRNRVREEASKLIGKKYDFTQIVWYVLKDLFNLKGNNRFNNPNNLICSELVYIVLEQSGILNDLGIDTEDIRGVDLTPNQLYDLVKFVSKK